MIMPKLIKKGFALLLSLTLAATIAACSDDSVGELKLTDDLLPVFDKTLGIEETELIQIKGIKITATELSYTNYEAVLGIRIENTSKKPKEIYSETIGYSVNSVNGYMIEDGYMCCEIAAGETKEEEIGFSYTELFSHGISKIADIEVGFTVHENQKSYKTGPLSIKTSAAGDYDYNTDSYLKAIKGKALKNAYGITVDSLKEKQLYSEGGISLISEAVMSNKDGEKILMLEFESKSDRIIYTELSDLTINGIVVEGGYTEGGRICEGKRYIMSLRIGRYMDEDEQLRDKKPESISFRIRLKNDDYDELTQKKTVSIKF